MTRLAGIHHVKLPVSDVVASRDWYQRTLGLELDIEFVEEGAPSESRCATPAGPCASPCAPTPSESPP